MRAFLGFIVLTIGLSLFFGSILDIDILIIIYYMILCLVIICLGCYLMGGGL